MNRIRSFALASLLVAVAACGGKSKKDTTPVADTGMTCEQVAEKLGHAMETTGEMPEEVIGGMMDKLIATCTDTAWSADTKSCFAAATSGEATESCDATMTDDQKSAFMQAMGEHEGDEKGDAADDDADYAPSADPDEGGE